MTTSSRSDIDTIGFEQAYQQAVEGAREGGIPIGSALVWHRDKVEGGEEWLSPKETYEILGTGRNRRVQEGSAILHAEISALDNAGRLKAEVYRNSTIVSLTRITVWLPGCIRIIAHKARSF